MAKINYTLDATLGPEWDHLKLTTLEMKITALEARIVALEAPGKLTVETLCPECQARQVGRILARQAREAVQ